MPDSHVRGGAAGRGRGRPPRNALHQRERRLALLLLVFGMLVHPFVARAQQPARLGYLSLGTAMTAPALRAAVIQGLRDLGHVEGQSFVVEYRFAEGKPDRLGDLATELVRLKLALVFAEGTQPTAALKQATATVPTVMFACDAVTSGLVASAKAAKALGLAIPQSLVLRADQVVE